MQRDRPIVPPHLRFDHWTSGRDRARPHTPSNEFDARMWYARTASAPTGTAELDEYEERKRFFADLGTPE